MIQKNDNRSKHLEMKVRDKEEAGSYRRKGEREKKTVQSEM